MNQLYVSSSFSPIYNLSVEEYLFDHCSNFILFLWQNNNTVVIGKHQNAWQECRAELLRSEQGQLVRRTTGGGAVFHDLGNLNFTFIAPKAQYNIQRQLSMILQTLRLWGIDAAFSGRNDLVLPDGRKFSGNAFRHTDKTCMHHGTILVSTDMDRLQRYLAPSPEKYITKGFKSVRSRVCNLSELCPNITTEVLCNRLAQSYEQEYGPYTLLSADDFDPGELAARMERHRSYEWVFGNSMKFDLSLENRFSWGKIQLLISVHSGIIQNIKVYSDTMDETFIDDLCLVLIGKHLNGKEMANIIESLPSPQAKELANWIGHKNL